MSATIPPALAEGTRLPNAWDAAAILCVFAALIGVAHEAPGTFQRIDEPQALAISLDPIHLPDYALRTTMRMFAALLASLLFTFTYATAAAKSRRAALILVPILDILQSVPILGFLSFTVVFFMHLFPGRVLGLELAAIFAIFTSQAWNMAFSLYQSLKTVPADLKEAADSFHLTAWQRYWRLEVPFATPGLVWNTMMSMSGGWFFVVASEAVSVGDNTWKLPGIGSYVALALEQRDILAVCYAIMAMLAVILAYDQLLFRPLVAWSAKFRFETTAGATAADPWLLRLMRRTRLLSRLADAIGDTVSALGGLPLAFGLRRVAVGTRSSRLFDAVGVVVLVAVLAWALTKIVGFISADLSWSDLGQAVVLGLITLVRVAVLMVLASLLWVPIGVWLGLRPVWARRAQPLAQFLAAFPANLLFPPVVLFIVYFQPECRYLADAADDPGHPVVHPVQRHRRRGGVSRRPARGGKQFPDRRLAMVAQGDDPGDSAVLRDRRDHRLGRLVECRHRRRGGVVGRYQADSAWSRRLYRGGDRTWRHGARRAGRSGDVGLCAAVQPPAVAPAVRLFGTTPEAWLIEEARMDTIVGQQCLLEVRGCKQAYHKDASADLVVLDDVNLMLREGEMVALLGRSGSGKSTLLRIVAGLLTPTAGEVLWRDRPVHGPAEGVAMVFQSFALFPWLTVQENVELGLEARGVPRSERKSRAEAAIDLIGLGGFESAYPKELSGGMRQRVGLARALVVHPDLLLMDEPFSALDVLTAENLRTDLIDLWSEGKLPVRSVLMVTHNIEEAVLMCDRILVFASNPGRVANELRVPFPHPRNRLDPAFRQLVDDIYGLMTRRPVPSVRAVAAPPVSIAVPLYRVGTNQMAGLMEALAGPPYNGRADLPALAAVLQYEVDELLPLGETLQLLHFAVLEEGDIHLTEEGRRFVAADTEERKRLFAAALTAYVPLARMVRQVLDERWNHRASAVRFRDELEDHMSPEYAEDTLRTLVAWGRYAELFSYDEEAEQFSLEDIG